MGLSLRKLGSKIWDEVNPLDNGRTFSNQTPQNNQSVRQQLGNAARPVAQAYQNAARVVAPVVDAAQPFDELAQTAGKVIAPVVNAVPEVPDTSPLRFANNAVIRPFKTTESHAADILQGNNPYRGSLEQQAGQLGQDVINAASVLPVGRGAEIALKGAPVAAKIAQGAKFGVKTGAGFGAAQGAATSLQDELGLKDSAKNIGINTVAGAGLGGALGAGAPALAGAGKVALKRAGEIKLPQTTPLGQEGRIRLPGMGGNDFHYSSSDGITTVSGNPKAVIKKLNEVGGVGKDVRPNVKVDKLPNGSYRALDTSTDSGYGLAHRATGKTPEEAQAKLAQITQTKPKISLKKLNEQGGGAVEDSPIRKKLQSKEEPTQQPLKKGEPTTTTIPQSGNKYVKWRTVDADGYHYQVSYKIGKNGEKTVTRENIDEAGNVTGVTNMGTLKDVQKKYGTDDPAEIALRSTTGEVKSYDKAGNPIWENKGDFYEPPQATQVGENNSVGSSANSTLHQLQTEQADRYKVSLKDKVKNKVLEAIYDPRAVEQKLDNQRFKQLKEAGQTRSGQSELLPDQSLAVLRGKILNPYEPAGIRDKTKYATPGGEFSVNDVIKAYGKDDSPTAKNFEVYRIYKDELERQGMGENPSIPVTPQEMNKYVAGYEASNPNAIHHNAALREHALQAVRDLEAIGTEAPGTADNLSRYKYYTPRNLQSPEEMARMQISGGIKGGQRGVQGRTQFNEAPTSPLSIFKQISVNTERDIANQKYGQELKARIDEGALPGGSVAVDAKDVALRKDLLKTAQDYVDSAKKASARASNVRADLRTSNVLKGGAEYQAATKAKKALYKMVQGEDARAAISSMSREDLLEVFRGLVDDGNPNLERLRTNLIKKSKANGNLVDELVALKQQVQSDREIAQGLKSEGYQLENKTSRNTQSFPYRENGEIGKIDLPGELAQGISKQNETNLEQTIGKSLRGFSNAQKAVWTGILQPAFKAWNVLVKNPLLMFINADGLSGVRPEVAGSFARQLLHTDKMQAFKQEMMKRGIAYENAFQSKNIQQETAKDIAERANLTTFFARNPVRILKDFYRGLNTALASLDNAQRYGVATGAYKRAKELGFGENEALDIASQASSKVFGDFNRITQLAQAMEPLIPYTGATQAGQRALYRSAKTRPVETAVKATALMAGMGSLAWYSINNANQYYNDMISQGKEYALDNNLVIALPGAHKDDKGQWHGIVNVPLLPDVRPMNRAIWKTAHSIANDQGVDPGMIASEGFNQSTGDLKNQLYDGNKGKKGGPATGALPSSPIVSTGKTLANINTYDGGQLADEYTQSLPRTEQVAKNTSASAKAVSKLTRGAVTPLQADQLASSAGTAGDVFQKPKESLSVIGKSFVKPVQPATSQTAKQKSGAAYYKDLDSVAKTAGDRKDYREFIARHEKNKDDQMLNGAQQATTYLNNAKQFDLDKELDKRARSRGEPGNPLYELSPDKVQKILTYRANKIYNSAGQNRDKDGNTAFTSLGLDEKWYEDFSDKENKFYASLAKNKAINNGKSKSEADKVYADAINGQGGDDYKTFSGAIKPPKSPELNAKLEQYYALGKGTGQRSAFLKANPDILDYWSKSNGFTNQERVALGFDALDDSDSSSGGSSKFASSKGGGGGNKNSVESAYKYAISAKAGGKIAKPRVTAKVGKPKIAKKGNSKIKVSSKKSLV